MGKNTPKQVHDKDADSDRLISALKVALKTRRITMRQLSDSLGIPYRSLQNYFSGESRLPADVLLAICRCIGVEADYLSKGTFELFHEDLRDAVWKVFGELLPHIHITPDGRALLRSGEPASRTEAMSAAYLLTVQLNEAYAACREQTMKTTVLPPLTSSEVAERATRSGRLRKVGE